jgi:hypothetical protein
MMDEELFIIQRLLEDHNIEEDDEQQIKWTRELTNEHGRKTAFRYDVKHLVGEEAVKRGDLTYVEEMRIKIGFSVDPVYVTEEEDPLFYGAKICQAEDGAKFLVIEYKGSKDGSSERKSQLAFTPPRYPRGKDGNESPGSRLPPEEISFQPSRATCSFSENRDTGDVDMHSTGGDTKENKSTTSKKSITSIASGPGKKKMKVTKLNTFFGSAVSPLHSSTSRTYASSRSRTTPASTSTRTTRTTPTSTSSRKRSGGAISSLRKAASDQNGKEGKTD